MSTELSNGLNNMKWKPADKYVGGALLGLAVIVFLALGYGFFLILPLLLEMAKNTLIFVAMIVVLALVAMVVGDPKTWYAVYYKWQNTSRNIRKSIVHEDPVGVLQTAINRFDSKLEQIDENIKTAVGACKRHALKMREAAAKKETALADAVSAKRMGKNDQQVAVFATAASRWDKVIEDMHPLQDTLSGVQTSLEKARDLCAVRLEDLKNQKEVLALRLETMQAGQASVKSLKRLFKNDPDFEFQDMAIEEIERQSADAEAEIDQFLRVMQPVLESADTKRQGEALQAMDKFNAYLEGKPAQAALPQVVIETPTVGNATVKEKELVRRN